MIVRFLLTVLLVWLPTLLFAATSGRPLSLPPRVDSMLPGGAVNLIRGGAPVPVRAQGLNLGGVSAHVVFQNRVTTTVTSRITARSESTVTLELAATASAVAGTGYVLRFTDSRTGTALNLPLQLRVVEPARTAVAPRVPSSVTTIARPGPQPPVSSWTKEAGAASGSTIEFRSESGFDTEGLPSMELLELRLGNVLLDVQSRSSTSIVARIPYAPLPQIRTNLPLTVSYRNVANSMRTLDQFYLLDPAMYDPQQARISALRAVGGFSLDAIPYSTEVALEITIANYPFPRMDKSDLRFGLRPHPSDCLNLRVPGPGFTVNRSPEGSLTVSIGVYSFGSCQPIQVGTPLLRVVGAPASRYAPTSSSLFLYHDQPIVLATRTPRTVTVQSTWALKELFDPLLAVSPFTACEGKVAGQSVGIHEFGGDLAFIARSAPFGNSCTFFLHRLGAGEGIRFGKGVVAPINEFNAIARATDIEVTVSSGGACEIAISDRFFDREAPDTLPTDRVGGQLPLRDELPVIPVRMKCAAASGEGKAAESDFILLRIDSVTFSVDPLRAVDASNIPAALQKLCFPSRLTDNCVPYTPPTGESRAL